MTHVFALFPLLFFSHIFLCSSFNKGTQLVIYNSQFREEGSIQPSKFSIVIGYSFALQGSHALVISLYLNPGKHDKHISSLSSIKKGSHS